MLKGYELGAEDYVTKPFPYERLSKSCPWCWGGWRNSLAAIAMRMAHYPSISREMTASLSSKPLVFTPLGIPAVENSDQNRRMF